VDDRHSRQTRFAPIGPGGQERLRRARVLVAGCGALGGAAAEQLCRAGVGHLRLVDRDLVDSSNLQRQTLFTSADAEAALPKVVAARARLAAIDAGVAVEAIVAEIGGDNIRALVAGCDLVIDGSDNFPLRHLVNEACCEAGVPWIYAACVGAYAVSLPIVPGETPCLRCLQDQLPAAGESPTCDSVGIIAPAVHLAAAWQVAEALKLLVGDLAALRRDLVAADLWAGTWQRLRLDGARDPSCPVCGPHPSYPALRAPGGPAIVLCGRDAVQVASRGPADLAALAAGLGPALRLANPHLVRWVDGDLLGTCFRDGRVVVQGTGDLLRAAAFRDRWLG
jgi:molybdopterin/thiamine biosynthesis adenylyltransferase